MLGTHVLSFSLWPDVWDVAVGASALECWHAEAGEHSCVEMRAEAHGTLGVTVGTNSHGCHQPDPAEDSSEPADQGSDQAVEACDDADVSPTHPDAPTMPDAPDDQWT